MKKLLVILCLALAASAWTQTPAKYALVIGNADYRTITKLNNPGNDADDMTSALRGLGFTVETLKNASLDQMEGAAVRLKTRLSSSRSSYGFFYYAGHAVESGGVNYLIPADASIQSESFLRQRAVAVQSVLGELNTAGNALNIVVLDACRDNPFPWSRGTGRGLTVELEQPADSIIVFATSAGTTAADGTGRNGLFTGRLLPHLKTPGLEINEVFRRTMGDVVQASGNKQRPAVYNQFPGLAYLAGAPAVNVPRPVPAVQPAARVERPIPANFVRVEGGTFQMGSNDGESDEKPVHSVTVKGFYMGKYEVTQKEWVGVMGNNPSYFKGDNRPVEQVSWNDVVEYCNRRSAKEDLTPAYNVLGNTVTWNRNATGYRLPTEAEWEYAAKGGTKGGAEYRYSGSDNEDSVAWHSGTTHDVGTKAPNSLGIYDMSGNVWEWCWDWYGRYGSGAQTDPMGASSGSRRVLRGGSLNNSARSAERSIFTPSNRYSGNGFRLIRP